MILKFKNNKFSLLKENFNLLNKMFKMIKFKKYKKKILILKIKKIKKMKMKKIITFLHLIINKIKIFNKEKFQKKNVYIKQKKLINKLY